MSTHEDPLRAARGILLGISLGALVWLLAAVFVVAWRCLP